MIFNDLPPDLMTRIARCLNEPARDQLLAVNKSCLAAVREARIVDLYEDLKRPERTNKEMLPIPRELLKENGHDYVYGNILKNLSHLNPPNQRGPLWKFYQGCDDLFRRYAREPKTRTIGLCQGDGASHGFGRWKVGTAWVLGTLVGGRAYGLSVSEWPGGKALYCWNAGRPTGYGLEIVDGKTCEGDFNSNYSLVGPGKITNVDGTVILVPFPKPSGF